MDGGLDREQRKQLRAAFDTFDVEKRGYVNTKSVSMILAMLGHEISDEALQDTINEIDVDQMGQLSFDQFCMLSSRFIVEEDTEAIANELKEAFRLYDKEGNGYITTDVFRDILHELDDQIPPEELDMMIDEIDADGSGTLDFDEFMTAMTGE